MHLFEEIDCALLKEAASLFVGRHDFTTFANSANKGSAAKGAIRDLYRLDVIQFGKELRLEFEANGFLYKMVRNIVGTLIEVATYRRPCEEIPELLKARDRRLAGKTVAPQGLCLINVNYTVPKNLEYDDRTFVKFP
jgi:tRNA pseudouridine38-40 synthase